MRTTLDRPAAAQTTSQQPSAPTTGGNEPTETKSEERQTPNKNEDRRLLGFLFEKRQLSLLDVAGENASASASLNAQIIDPESATITEDPLRMATNEAIEEEGLIPVWIQTGGQVEGAAGFNGTPAVAAGPNAQVGFAAEASLSYATTQPYGLVTAEAATELVGNTTIDLPVNSEKALAMRAGAEVEVVGSGTLLASGSAGARYGFTAGPAQVGLHAGVEAQASITGEFSLEVRRLEGDQVQVTVSKLSERSASVAAELEAGVVVSEGGPKSREEQALDATLRLDVSARGSVEREVIGEYTIDLSTEEGQAAYGALIRLDTRAAEAESVKEGGAVTATSYVSKTKESERRAELAINGETLLLSRALRSDTTGRSNQEGEVKLLREASYVEESSFILTGERQITWEGVAVTDETTGEQASFFHLGFDHTDKVTTDRDLEVFARFADAMGAEEAGARSMEPPKSNVFTRLFGKKDDTQVGVDVYFTHAGIEQLAGASKEQAAAAYVSAAGAVDPNLAGAPVLEPQAQATLQAYQGVRDELLLAQRSGASNIELDAIRRRMHGHAGEYRETYGRPFNKDIELLERAQSFGAKVESLGETGDAEAWAGFYADLGADERFGYMSSIAAMRELAGAENTVVNRLSIEGEGVYLEAVEQVVPDDPREGLRPETTPVRRRIEG